ncbi:MAG: BON domain-containing protein [Acidobacteriota bacterium]|nr:BON domain-containing protein [Acidobacteriota bacterium]
MGQRVAERNQEIQEAVRRELKASGVLGKNGLRVRVEAGVVTLTGIVGTMEKKIAARNAAQRAPGVLDVAEDLDLRTSRPPASVDAAIARAARARLRRLLGEEHENVHVTVADGCLRFEGRVPNAALRQEAFERLRTLGGLRALINCLEVKPDPVTGPPKEGAGKK